MVSSMASPLRRNFPSLPLFGLAILLTLGAFLSLAGAQAAPSSPKPRGLWFWSKPTSPLGAANVVGDPAREEEACSTFARWGVRRLYGSYAALPTEAPQHIAAWNRRLHKLGIRSESLFGDNAAALPEGRDAFLKQIDARVLAFNASRTDASERFDGLALDIEPHALPRWKSGTNETRRAILEEYLATCTALRAHLDAKGGREIALSAALAYWLDRLPPEGRVGWTSAADRDDWFTRLARVVPTISLMAYERNTPGTILEAVAWEQTHFPGRVVTALRARLGAEWKTLSDLERVLPEVEAASTVGIDLENYELLRLAETAQSTAAGAPPTAAVERPNLLFIIVDDLYIDMLNYTSEGRGRNYTPHLDRLAKDSTVMNGQLIVSPVCTPSRYNCLTGRYASRATNPQFVRQSERAGTTIVTWNNKIMPGEPTLARQLRQAGYVTGFAGKQHTIDVQGRKRPPVDADPRDPAIRAMLSHNERVEREAVQAAGFDEAGGIYMGNPDELTPAMLRVHNMDWVAQAGVEFLARHAGGKKPFFLYFAPTLAHSPYTPDRSWNADPRITPFGLLDAPPTVLPSREDRARRLRKHPGEGRHRENLLWLDDAIGALLAQLEKSGALERTIIVFFNDNGQDGKGSIYQSAARAPSLIWRSRPFPCGPACDVRVTNLDFAPTLLDFAGVRLPEGAFDGRSFRPILEGRSSQLHEAIYFELGFTRGVLRDNWKYIALRYPPEPERFALLVNPPHLKGRALPQGQPAFGHIGGNNNELAAIKSQPAYFDRDQLYDLATDPKEQRNLAADPAHAATLAAMKRELQKHLERLPGGFGELKPAR